MTPTEAAAPTTVAFIGGLGRSGSTLLCRLLEGLDGATSVGEMRNLWDFGVLRDNLCGCGKPFSECPFWTAVGDKAFGGWDPATAERAVVLRKNVDRLRQVPKLALGRDAEGFGRDADEYADLIASIYQAVQAVTDAKVVVDSSKLPSTGYLMRRTSRLDPRMVHLVRDSRGAAHSWNKVFKRTDAEMMMKRRKPAATAVHWNAFNLLTDALALQGVPVRRVRYEDLIDDPAGTLARIAEFVGLPLVPDALDFVKGEAVELPVDHSVWGNPVRTSSGPQPLRRDEAWRQGLSARQKASVTALTAPGLVRYGYLTRGR